MWRLFHTQQTGVTIEENKIIFKYFLPVLILVLKPWEKKKNTNKIRSNKGNIVNRNLIECDKCYTI